jgi:hypothetical protein
MLVRLLDARVDRACAGGDGVPSMPEADVYWLRGVTPADSGRNLETL